MLCSGVPGKHIRRGEAGAHAAEVPDGCVATRAGDDVGEEVAAHGAGPLLHLPGVFVSPAPMLPSIALRIFGAC